MLKVRNFETYWDVYFTKILNGVDQILALL